jgi:hypothetical protein
MFLPIANTQEMRREHTDVVFVQPYRNVAVTYGSADAMVGEKRAGPKLRATSLTRPAPVGERRATRLDPARRGRVR